MFHISKFSKWPPFWARDKLFTVSYTGRRIYQKDSHEHFRHFELLIDAVIQILTKNYQFQNLTYFVTWWRHEWRHEYVFIISLNGQCHKEHARNCIIHRHMYIYILLLISMLWHRQAIFKSKGDKLCSSAECRIWTRGPRHRIASRLNARWQTDWAIEDQAKTWYIYIYVSLWRDTLGFIVQHNPYSENAHLEQRWEFFFTILFNLKVQNKICVLITISHYHQNWPTLNIH